jgi:hypothetical protein
MAGKKLTRFYIIISYSHTTSKNWARAERQCVIFTYKERECHICTLTRRRKIGGERRGEKRGGKGREDCKKAKGE